LKPTKLAGATKMLVSSTHSTGADFYHLYS